MDQREGFGELQEVIKDASLPSQHKGGWTQQDFKFKVSPGYILRLSQKEKKKSKNNKKNTGLQVNTDILPPAQVGTVPAGGLRKGMPSS